MAQPEGSADSSFVLTVFRGLAELGPIDLRENNLVLELGLSLWLRRCGTSLAEASEAMMVIRTALVDTAGMDHATEPIPLVGRSPKGDLVNLAGYVSQLIPRAVLAAPCDRKVLLESVSEALAHHDVRRCVTSRAAG
jgi:hypothetical protein